MKIAHDEKVESSAEEQMILDLTVRRRNKWHIHLSVVHVVSFCHSQTDQEEAVEEFLRDIFFAQEQVHAFDMSLVYIDNCTLFFI
jgi:hypothetical protein